MGCGKKFNFGHASKWDRQQIEKKAKVRTTNTLIDEDPFGLEAMKRDLEEKLAAVAAKEEWIWVEGYKGTDANMVCHDYKYDLNVIHSMPEGSEIIDCASGFHFCRDLIDVFSYYNIEDGNRFFRVRALVRKKDYENYGKRYEGNVPAGWYIPNIYLDNRRDKLAAKSIQFLYELTPDEVFAPLCEKYDEYKTWDTEQKTLAMERGIKYVRNIERVKELVSLGYSDAFAQWIVEHHKYYNVAVAVGSQTGLSMDMKVLMILKG